MIEDVLNLFIYFKLIFLSVHFAFVYCLFFFTDWASDIMYNNGVQHVLAYIVVDMFKAC